MQARLITRFEFSDVAGPVVFLQHPGDRVVHPSYRSIQIGIEPLDEMADQQWNVVAAIPQRRQTQRDDGERLV